MLERSILRYCSEPSLPSHKLPISALVPEMICNRLFNSLVAFETDSFETDLRGVRGCLSSEFTVSFCSNPDAFLIEIIIIRSATWRARSGADKMKSSSQSARGGLCLQPLRL